MLFNNIVYFLKLQRLVVWGGGGTSEREVIIFPNSAISPRTPGHLLLTVHYVS